jgi:hypothetical protein
MSYIETSGFQRSKAETRDQQKEPKALDLAGLSAL